MVMFYVQNMQKERRGEYWDDRGAERARYPSFFFGWVMQLATSLRASKRASNSPTRAHRPAQGYWWIAEPRIGGGDDGWCPPPSDGDDARESAPVVYGGLRYAGGVKDGPRASIKARAGVVAVVQGHGAMRR